MEIEIHELRKDLKTYRPGNGADCLYDQEGVQFPDQLVIGLFGRSGCGKISLVNSMKFAVSELIPEGKCIPIANSEHTGGQTPTRVIAKLVENIFVVKNCGLDDLTKEGTLAELEAQIDGKRGYAKQVVWKKTEGAGDMDGIPDLEKRKDPIGCVVFVFSALDSIKQNINGLYQVVSFLHTKQDRYPLAVITNVDRVGREIVDELRSTLQVSGISEVFEVANITTKTTLQNSHQHSLLSLLDRCMTDGDAAVVFKQNQEREQTEKKESGEKRKSEENKLEERNKQSYDLQDNRAKGKIKRATTTGDTVRLPVGGPDVPAVVADKTTSVLSMAAIVGGVTIGLAVASVTLPVGVVVVAGAGVGAAGLVAAAGKVPTSVKKICNRLNPQSNTPAEHREADQRWGFDST